MPLTLLTPKTHTTDSRSIDAKVTYRMDAACDADTPDTHDDPTPRWLQTLFRDRDPMRPIAPGGLICLDGDRADHLFRVESGTVRCCTISEDGRRQIFGFARPGDFLGFSDMETWHFTAEAVDTVTLRSVSRAMLESIISKDPALERDVRRIMVQELVRRERQLMAVAFLQSDDRLLTFLKEQAAATTPREGYTLLPMTRQDIGDHIGMSLETVSRSFTALKRKGRIIMPSSDRFRLASRRQIDPVQEKPKATSHHIAA